MGFGANLITEKLKATPAILALVETFVTQPAIWFDTICPTDFKGTESINFYLTSPVNGGLEFGLYNYTINCRSKTHNGAKTLQNTVFTALNRKLPNSERGIFNCNALQVISPSSEDDTYNAPVEAKVKQ